MPLETTHDPGATLRFEIKNSKPVDLLDLTTALSAFGEAYQDYTIRYGLSIERVGLFIKDIRTGSIIADLISIADQSSFILDHIHVAAGFVSHVNDVLQFLLFLQDPPKNGLPTKREAAQAMSIMEPIAKDGGAQLFLQVMGDLHTHHHVYNSREANAIQNSARRLLGPQIPAAQVRHDELLTLFQVRGDAAAKVGDKGIIESISLSPVKLTFSSEEVKGQIVEQSENPFRKIFIVDVEVKSAVGKPRLYRILSVKGVLDRD
jgi:hypothetical protein